MARTALTVIGYAVGTYFGYPQLGAIVGAYVGSVVDPTKIEGPRIADTAAQQSSYGAAISKTWGGDRIAGTLIWAAPMVEHQNEEGSKGDSTEITTYTYTRSFAILIGEGHIESIRRIWADTKPILDYRDADNVGAQAGSFSTARYFEFYQGTEDQLPDPTIEAVEGEGNVEAYRGRSYIVFTDFPLGDYGNRIPMFSFEVSNEPTLDESGGVLEPLRVYPWMVGANGPVHSRGETEYAPLSSPTTTSFPTAATDNANEWSVGFENWRSQAVYSTTYLGFYTDSVSNVYSADSGGANALVSDAESVTLRMGVAVPDFYRHERSTFYNVGSDTWNYTGEGITAFVKLTGGGWTINEALIYQITYTTGSGTPPAPLGFNANFASGVVTGTGNSIIFYGNPVLPLYATRVPTIPPDTCMPGADPCAAGVPVELPDAPGYCYSCDGTVTPKYVYTRVDGTAKQLCAIEYRDGALYQNALGPVLLPGDQDYDNAAFWTAAFDAAVLAGTIEPDVTYPVVVSAYASGSRQNVFEVAAGSVLLSDIVAEVCEECGLESSQYDVDALDDVVLGYSRGRRMTGRATLEPLRTAFFFDAVESGDLIRFVKRGGAPAGSIDSDELSAAVDESTNDLVISDRGQEAELPRSVTIAYKAVSADFQTGTQQSRRRVGDSEQKAGAELAIVLTDAKAAQVAEVLLYDSWVTRNRRSFTLGREWSAVEPTDVLEVSDGEFTYRLRVVETSEQDGVITVADARDDDASIYVSAVAGAPVAGAGSAMGIPGPTAFELMDIPLLRQADDSAGVYLGASGYMTAWRGGRVFRSTDAGATFSTFQDVTRKAVMGAATSVLATYGGGNTIDELHTVDVTVREGGELASITLAQLLQRGNPALLGDEVIQFMRATLLSPGNYRLSGLLRGRFGTEQHMGAHVIGERFVFLSASQLYRPAFELSLVGSELVYKAASFGEATAGSEVEFTNTAAGLKPLSPVHLHVAQQPDGSYVAQWVRRTRFSEGGIRIGVDAPLAEANERYRVSVLDAGTAVETQIVTAPLATVGAALTSDDYAGLTLEVVQLSDLVGEGFPASIVIP